MSDIPKLNKRLGDYFSNTQIVEIDDSKPAAIVMGPVEAGINKFIDVDNLPSLDELPFISERHRDFAYRYATEYKSRKEWAKEYNVNPVTIDKWLRTDGIRTYIALARFEKRFYTMARRVSLENMVWKRIKEFLSMKVTGDNANAMARILEFSWRILNEPEEFHDRSKGVFNQQIFMAPSSTGNPYAQTAQERDVTPTPRQLEDLRKRIERVSMLNERADEMGSDGGSD